MQSAARPRVPSDARHLPNAVLGMLVFVAVETVFFAALISAHTIARSTAPGGVWPPPGQPRLPVERTAINTLALLLSGVALWVSSRQIRANAVRSRQFLTGAIFLGLAFVSLQGVEWVRLLREGLTITSSTHGGFFYLIVGMHALHAVAAIAALVWAYVRMTQGKLVPGAFAAVQIFWYFVVVLWPVIYLRVYF